MPGRYIAAGLYLEVVVNRGSTVYPMNNYINGTTYNVINSESNNY